jgi:SAM-dependent methyltransferase
MVLSDAVVWHDIECGAYSADLSLWRELAALASSEQPREPLLDIGAGSGRVALDLAAHGHLVTAVDRDAELLEVLRERALAAGTPVQTVCADARTFALERRDFALCLAPMQTVQLLEGASGRIAFLRQAHTHLRPGGLLACAIVADIEPFDCAAGDIGPSPEIASVDGSDYISRAIRVRVGTHSVLIERERSTHSAAQRAAHEQPRRERDVVELDRLTVSKLRGEGRQAGFTSAGTRSIPATDEHVGSDVVLLRA